MATLPFGASLLLTGSGVYWVLSSQSIFSFSVLLPGLFESNSAGILVVLLLGVFSCLAGLWGIDRDLEKLGEMLNRRMGWLLTLPVLLAILDICVTVVGQNSVQGIRELNPVVGSAIVHGTWFLLPFTISYILLSEGLALLMLNLGCNWFAHSPTLAGLPFSIVCASASIGSFSNIALIAIPGLGLFSLVFGVVGATGFSCFAQTKLKDQILLFWSGPLP